MIAQQGTLPGHGTVWYHPQVSVNILSMAKLKQQYPIKYKIVAKRTPLL